MVLRRIQFCSAADAPATALMQLPHSSWQQKATSGPFQLVPEPQVSALAQMSCTCGRMRVELTTNSEVAELAPVGGTSLVPLPPSSTTRSSSLYGRPNSPASFALPAKSLYVSLHTLVMHREDERQAQHVNLCSLASLWRSCLRCNLMKTKVGNIRAELLILGNLLLV
jgi:hypothetical protein